MKILVLHGPNLNLLGLRSAELGTRVTLEKVNRALRHSVREMGIDLKIYQTQDEAKASVILQRQRNLVDGILVAPGPWKFSGFVLKDTLEIIKKPVSLVGLDNDKQSIFSEFEMISDSDPLAAYQNALKQLIRKISPVS